MKGLFKKTIIAIVVVLAIYITYENYEMKKVQKGIADKIIRFHIRANSESESDQKLKLLVKDSVMDYLKENLEKEADLSATIEFLETHREEIITLAKTVIAGEGYDYDVNAYFEESYFPLKTYGDMSFPPGIYNAFRIDIGAAGGKNWWCVLYPRLCFVDCTYSYVPYESKEEFKNILNDREYRAISGKTLKGKDIKFDLRIKHIFSNF